MHLTEETALVKKWLGAGSINIFGLPLSGKTTQGEKLAKALDGKFLSSDAIVRQMYNENRSTPSNHSNLLPTQSFYKWILPYFERRAFWDIPLILSAVGRCSGEENQVIQTAYGAGHPLKAVIYLTISQATLTQRWQKIQQQNRPDLHERNWAELQQNIVDFRDNTLSVLRHYRELDLLLIIDGNRPPEKVYTDIIQQLAEKAR